MAWPDDASHYRGYRAIIAALRRVRKCSRLRSRRRSLSSIEPLLSVEQKTRRFDTLLLLSDVCAFGVNFTKLLPTSADLSRSATVPAIRLPDTSLLVNFTGIEFYKHCSVNVDPRRRQGSIAGRHVHRTTRNSRILHSIVQRFSINPRTRDRKSVV